jgi:hypothetical protein
LQGERDPPGFQIAEGKGFNLPKANLSISRHMGASVCPADFVLYDGETCAPFGEGMHAVTIRSLWETT